MSTLEEAAKSFWEARGEQSREAPTRAVTLAPVSEEEAIFLDRLESDQLLPIMNLRPGMRVLDVGCGAGRWTRRFASHGANVVACDVSSSLLDILRGLLAKDGLAEKVQLCRADLSIGELPAEIEGRFDLIFVGGVHQYLEDDAVLSLMREYRARLTPGGKLMLREGVRRERAREEHGTFEGAHYSVLYRDRSDYPRLFTQAGLRLISQKNLAGFSTVDLVEKLLRKLNVASYGSAEQLELSPDGELWAKFITTVTPFFAAVWPRADRGAIVLHKLLGERDFWASHQVFLLAPQ